MTIRKVPFKEPRFQITRSITVLIRIAPDFYEKLEKHHGMDKEKDHPHHRDQGQGRQDHHQEAGDPPDPDQGGQDPGRHQDHQEGEGEPLPASWRAGGSPVPGRCLCPTPGQGQRGRIISSTKTKIYLTKVSSN